MKRRSSKRYEIRLPQLHADQRAVAEQTRGARFVHLRAGRRWGKSHLLARMLVEAALVRRQTVGYFVSYHIPLTEAEAEAIARKYYKYK